MPLLTETEFFDIELCMVLLLIIKSCIFASLDGHQASYNKQKFSRHTSKQAASKSQMTVHKYLFGTSNSCLIYNLITFELYQRTSKAFFSIVYRRHSLCWKLRIDMIGKWMSHLLKKKLRRFVYIKCLWLSKQFSQLNDCFISFAVECSQWITLTMII